MSIRDRVRGNSGVFSRLYRYPSRGWVAGVCVGLGEYFDWNPKLIRVLFVVAFIFGGFFPAGLVYGVLWYLMDEPGVETAQPASERHFDAGSSARYERSSSAATTGDVKSRFARMEERLRNMEECVSSQEFELRRELKKLES